MCTIVFLEVLTKKLILVDLVNTLGLVGRHQRRSSEVCPNMKWSD